MFFSGALPHHTPVRSPRAGGFTLLETLVAFVVLIVFLVLAYSFVFRQPDSMSTEKRQSAEQRGIPEVKPGTSKAPASTETKEAPASPSSNSTPGR